MQLFSWLFCILFLLAVATRAALVVPDGFELRRIATDLNPTAMRTAPDGRIFFCEKHGVLRVIKDDVLLNDPVLTIKSLTTWNERGMLGLEFHPDFETNNWIYIHYVWTDGTLIKGRLSRFTLDGDVAVQGSETVIFETDPYPSSVGIHNGGSIVVDKNGKIFLTVGDVAVRTLAQDRNSTFGKIFRFNLDGSIPEDNPYYNNYTGWQRAIWAEGFRNPFMTAYNPDTDIAIFGDVGENTWEELNINLKGGNYGWPNTEGYVYGTTNYTNPKIAYNHGVGCAITGLSFYRNLPGAQYLFPSTYHGLLLFGDYCKGWIRYIDITGSIAVRNLTIDEINSFAPVLVQGTVGGLSMTQGLDGGLYFAERGTFNGIYFLNMGVLTGSIYKLIYTGSKAPVIYAPLEQWPAMPAGRTYTMTVGVSGAAPLTYKWYKNDEIQPLASTENYSVTPTLDMNGTVYRVEVSNNDGTVSSEMTLLVSGSPALRAYLTVAPQVYSAGEVIRFSVNVSDPLKDPTRLINWVIELSHQTHTHPFTTFSNVDRGNITIPVVGELDPVQAYNIYVYVSNSLFSAFDTFRIAPNLGKILLATNPPGLSLFVDEARMSLSGPLNITGVSKMARTYNAPATQTVGNKTYQFVGWSDGVMTSPRGMTFKVNTVQPLTANYCTVGVDCAEIPIAAPIQEPVAVPIAEPVAEPIAEPISVPVQPPVTEPIAVPVAEPQSEVVPVNEPVVQTEQPVSAPTRQLIASRADKITSILCLSAISLLIIV